FHTTLAVLRWRGHHAGIHQGPWLSSAAWRSVPWPPPRREPSRSRSSLSACRWGARRRTPWRHWRARGSGRRRHHTQP
ncbi:unnamed protein product, partial [Prorocentrum cordatum]